jgi:hypothetical protein
MNDGSSEAVPKCKVISIRAKTPACLDGFPCARAGDRPPCERGLQWMLEAI